MRKRTAEIKHIEVSGYGRNYNPLRAGKPTVGGRIGIDRGIIPEAIKSSGQYPLNRCTLLYNSIIQYKRYSVNNMSSTKYDKKMSCSGIAPQPQNICLDKTNIP